MSVALHPVETTRACTELKMMVPLSPLTVMASVGQASAQALHPVPAHGDSVTTGIPLLLPRKAGTDLLLFAIHFQEYKRAALAFILLPYSIRRTHACDRTGKSCVNLFSPIGNSQIKKGVVSSKSDPASIAIYFP